MDEKKIVKSKAELFEDLYRAIKKSKEAMNWVQDNEVNKILTELDRHYQ